ncbi:MAG: metal-sensitive transcriptional regulator [Actinomycetota bacterium]|nr:metal-sensitive transcriptional regulator [Actinomycetota bacterium]
MKQEHKQALLGRLKTVRGHVEAVIAMVDDERYCPEIMKQISALQGSLEKANRLLLQNHLETCVVTAVEEGRAAGIVDELMETLRYTPVVTGPTTEDPTP